MVNGICQVMCILLICAAARIPEDENVIWKCDFESQYEDKCYYSMYGGVSLEKSGNIHMPKTDATQENKNGSFLVLKTDLYHSSVSVIFSNLKYISYVPTCLVYWYYVHVTEFTRASVTVIAGNSIDDAVPLELTTSDLSRSTNGVWLEKQIDISYQTIPTNFQLEFWLRNWPERIPYPGDFLALDDVYIRNGFCKEYDEDEPLENNNLAIAIGCTVTLVIVVIIICVVGFAVASKRRRCRCRRDSDQNAIVSREQLNNDDRYDGLENPTLIDLETRYRSSSIILPPSYEEATGYDVPQMPPPPRYSFIMRQDINGS